MKRLRCIDDSNTPLIKNAVYNGLKSGYKLFALYADDGATYLGTFAAVRFQEVDVLKRVRCIDAYSSSPPLVEDMETQQDIIESLLKTGKLSRTFRGQQLVYGKTHIFSMHFYRRTFTKGVWDLHITSLNFDTVYKTSVSWEQVVAFVKAHYNNGSISMIPLARTTLARSA